MEPPPVPIAVGTPLPVFFPPFPRSALVPCGGDHREEHPPGVLSMGVVLTFFETMVRASFTDWAEVESASVRACGRLPEHATMRCDGVIAAARIEGAKLRLQVDVYARTTDGQTLCRGRLAAAVARDTCLWAVQDDSGAVLSEDPGRRWQVRKAKGQP